MAFGTFQLVIDGEQQDGTPETHARLHLTAQGSGTLRDISGDEFKFPPQFAKAGGQPISLPYTLTLFTDTTSGDSTTIGYEGYVTTGYDRAEFMFAAPQAGSTVNLVDLTESPVFPVSDLQTFRDEAEAARDEAVTAQLAAEAVGSSTDEITAGLVADDLTATSSAVEARVVTSLAADDTPALAAAAAVSDAADTLSLTQYVQHGFLPNTARPTDARMVIWVGATRPTNMAPVDLWVENTAGPYPIHDEFNRADAATLGTTDTGQAWTSPTWGIVSNQAKTTATGVAFFDALYADAQITTKIISHGAGTVGIVFRYVDSQNYFGITNTKVFKRVANVLTDLAATFDGGASLGINDTCRVVADGSSIKIYKQTASAGAFNLIGNYTDTSHQTATKHGLRSASAGGIVDSYHVEPV